MSEGWFTQDGHLCRLRQAIKKERTRKGIAPVFKGSRAYFALRLRISTSELEQMRKSAGLG